MNTLLRSLVLLSALISTHIWALEVENHFGDVTARTTWSKGKIHLVTGSVTVNPGIVLQIEAGAVVKFSKGTWLTVNGVLDAQGTNNEPIVFTSYRDELNGAIAKDRQTSAQPGDWGYLSWGDTATDAQNKISNIRILYAGNGGQSIYIDHANIAISNSHVLNGSAAGIVVNGCSPSLENNHIENNAGAGIVLNGADFPKLV